MGMFDDIPAGSGKAEPKEGEASGGLFKDIAAEAPKRDPSFSSVTEQAGVGLYSAATGLAGLPGDLVRAVEKTGGGYAFPQYGPGPVFSALTSGLPGQKDIQKSLEPVTGPVPPAQNVMEEYARTFGEFGPMAGTGGASLLGRVGRVLMPAVTAETAKQGAKKLGLSEGAQEWAKFFGAITPTTISYLWRTAPDMMEAAGNQLFSLASKNYKHPDVTGLQVKLPAAQTSIRDCR